MRAGTVQMVGTALARMAAATPIVSACFDADARVLKPVICWFSCSLFARVGVPSAASGCNGPKLVRSHGLADVHVAFSFEPQFGCRSALPAGVRLTTAATENGGRLWRRPP